MCHNALDTLGEIGGRIAEAKYRLLFIDLDGSYCSPGGNEVDSFLWERLKQLMASLVKRQNVSVAAMSAQDRTELHDRLGVAGITYLGNHGLEISGPGHIFIEPSASAKSTELMQLQEVLAAKLQDTPGVTLEDKGLSLVVQFGQVPPENVEQLRRTVHGALATSDHPFHLTTNENSFDIRPRVYWNKADAVAWVKEQIGHPDALVIYIDDNRAGDNPSASLHDAIILKVGARGESKAEQEYEVEGPVQAIDFLNWLDKFLEAQERGLTDERQRYSMV